MNTQQELQRGWLCPRCDTINAPHIDACSCAPSQGLRERIVPIYAPPTIPAYPTDGTGQPITRLPSITCFDPS